jgi:CMP-N,N'-diacetyllegionaminic acid synthase
VKHKQYNVCVIIPARGGSKRLKNKNIYPVLEKPMIVWSIDACKKSTYNPNIWVSTDSNDIAKVSMQNGAQVHMRDPKLAEDHVYKQAAIRSAAMHIEEKDKKYDIYISLQANSPEIKAYQIDEAIDALIINSRDEIFSVNNNLMQNAAFRVFRGEYVFQKDLSTNCGVYVCDIHDVHTIDDIEYIVNTRGLLK